MDALVRSLNIPTVNIGMKLGLTKVISVQQAMGWDKVTIPKVPSMLLGSYAISPYDVTKLYQTIANEGASIPLNTINSVVDRQGNVVYSREFEPKQVVPHEAAFQTLFAMQQVVDRGTAHSLQPDYAYLHLAGKTGTTNDARDTWFVGIDGENVTTIWLGRDDNGETKLTGASGALQVYKEYLKRATIRPLKLHKPEEIKWVGINAYGGWDCSSARTIPVWADRNQSFCQQTEYTPTTPSANAVESNNVTKQESVWDVLNEGNSAPVEDARPAN